MNRRQLSFVIILNALISLVIAMTVVWVVEARRPDPEVLAAISTPALAAINVPMAATLTPTPPQGTGAGEAAAPGGATTADQAAATPAEAAATPPADSEYVVQVGDSLSGIADRFGISVAALVSANDLDNPDVVFSGQRLLIPSGDAPLPAATATPIANSVTTGIRVAVENTGVIASEVINVSNDSDLALTLQGWRLEREGGPAYTFGNVQIFPGGGIKLHSGAGTDSSVDVYWNQAAAVWSAGAVARLLNPQGVEVARLAVP